MAPIVKLPKKPKLIPVHDAVREINDHAVMVLGTKRYYDAAIVETKRAIAVTPNSKELWSNLGTLYWNKREYQAALACVNRSLSLDGDYAKALFNKGLILEGLGKPQDAETYFEKALKVQPDFMDVTWARSLMWLTEGRLEEGFRDYEIRIPFRKNAAGAVYPKLPAPYWKGESLAGKIVFCCAEQGLGDTIFFSRWLPWLKEQVGQSGKVYFCCSHSIYILLWNYRHLFEYVPENVPIPLADISIVMGSLPHIAGTTLENIMPDPGLIKARAEEQMRIGKAEIPDPPGPNPIKVGIVWTGNPEQERNDERSIPLELMLNLSAHPNVWLYSLQGDPGRKDLERLGLQNIAGGNGLVLDLGEQLQKRGLPTAATAILQMDLVITCCTSMAHLAGALGVPAWVVLCERPYWVWMSQFKDSSPWYPSLKLFRQHKTNDWTGVMHQVQDELFSKIDAGQLLRRSSTG